MKFCSMLLLSAIALAARGSGQQLPKADEVVAKMMEHEQRRQPAFGGYTAARRYILENPRHHKRAEMIVMVKCLDNGAKQFQIVSATGWGVARTHVFPRLLESENEASMPDVREQSRITPENYSFAMVGREFIGQRPAYVLAVTPKTGNKYLIQGRVWIDLDDYAIVRIEGKPAKSPSFWIKSVQFTHTYQKNGVFWLPASDRSISDVRFMGPNELTIEYSDYVPKPPSALKLDAERRP